MTFNTGLFTSLSGEWITPSDLFDALWGEFDGFDLDPCGQREHHYTAHRIATAGGNFYDGSIPAMDGLTQPWHGKVYVNPPYGRGIGEWVYKCWSSVCLLNDCELVVALLPSRTDTKWWHNWVMEASEIRFIKGRLRFGEHNNTAPFANMVVIFNGLANTNKEV